MTIFMSCSYYVGYSYIEPFLQQVAHLDAAVITMALTVFGFAGLLGSVSFSRFFDGHRFGFLFSMIGGLALSLLLMQAASFSLASVFALCVLWGLCATAFNVAFQAEVISFTQASASAVAMSIFSGLFNLGIGCGTTIGGAVVSQGAIASIGYVGAGIGAVGVICTVAWLFPAIRRTRG